MATVEARTKKVISFSSRSREPPTVGRIDGPIRIFPVQTHGKPATIIPAPIARYYGFHNNWDWLAFDVTIVQGGILLTIQNRYADNEVRELKAGAKTAMAPATDGELLLPSNKTGLALSFAKSSQQRKSLIVIENGSSCNTAALGKGAK